MSSEVKSVSTKKQKSFFSTTSPFEAIIGYYRAVRHGHQIFVSGTTAVDKQSSPQAPQILFPGDAKQQTRVALEECLQAVRALGGTGPESVVRVRMFVARRQDCGAVGEAFRDILGKKDPADNGGQGAQQSQIGAAATMIVVPGGFVDENMMVEIEVDAIADDDAT